MNDEIDKFEEDFLNDDIQAELDKALDGMNLEEVMDAPQPSSAQQADGASGKVIAIQGEDIFVDLGGKDQGVLPAGQFDGDEPLPAVGDTIEFDIHGEAPDGLMRLARCGAPTEASWESLEVGQVVQGRVTGHNKGGLEINIDGIRAFMPISQIELFRVEELSPYDNQRLTCEVIDVNRSEKNLVVSRRVVMERDAAELAEQTWESLDEGQVVAGVVRQIMDYGAFVDIGGVDGLLHVAQMSYGRVEDPSSIVQEGQDIKVVVLKIDREARKVSLGLKQILHDPWSDVESKWPAGSLTTGRVQKLMDFGAFVELEAGVEGLIPISEMTY